MSKRFFFRNLKENHNLKFILVVIVEQEGFGNISRTEGEDKINVFHKIQFVLKETSHDKVVCKDCIAKLI